LHEISTIGNYIWLPVLLRIANSGIMSNRLKEIDMGDFLMNKTCFVTMPISGTTNQHDESYWLSFFDIIKSIMEGNGYSCCRSEAGPYSIFSSIANKLYDSDVVIAVLTDLNANVWYELGIRHALKSGTIMLLQEGQKIPFDVSAYGVIFYKDGISLQKQLQDSISKHLSMMNESLSDSPVLSTLSTKRVKELEDDNSVLKEVILQLYSNTATNKKRSEAENNMEILETVKHNVLWLDDYVGKSDFIKDLFDKNSLQFDITCNSDDAAKLYNSSAYDAVVVDVGNGERIDSVLNFIQKVCRRRSPVIFFGDIATMRKYSKEFCSIGATVTNVFTNVLKLLVDIAKGRPVF